MQADCVVIAFNFSMHFRENAPAPVYSTAIIRDLMDP